MNTNNQHREPETWTWLVVGLVFVAVTAMLYGPFIWSAHAAERKRDLDAKHRHISTQSCPQG